MTNANRIPPESLRLMRLVKPRNVWRVFVCADVFVMGEAICAYQAVNNAARYVHEMTGVRIAPQDMYGVERV